MKHFLAWLKTYCHLCYKKMHGVDRFCVLYLKKIKHFSTVLFCYTLMLTKMIWRFVKWHKDSHSGDCSLLIHTVSGTVLKDNSKAKLRILKVVPSILFINKRRKEIYVEIELYNCANENTGAIEPSNFIFEVFPTPSSPIECKSSLFKEKLSKDNKTNWTSMFNGFKADPCWNENQEFTYLLEYERKKSGSIHVVPVQCESLVSKHSKEHSVLCTINEFRTLAGNRVILNPCILTSQETIKVIAFYLKWSYDCQPEPIDEAATIHYFDFGIKDLGSDAKERDSLEAIDYFSFFAVLPQHGVLTDSQSILKVGTYSPNSVKRMFEAWYDSTRCNSTRSHRVMRITDDQYGKKHIFIEAIIDFPKSRFWKVLFTFLIALVGGLIFNAIVAWVGSNPTTWTWSWSKFLLYSTPTVFLCGIAIIFVYKR